MLDLAIRNGLVVTSDGTRYADVGISSGSIVTVGSAGSSYEEIDATNLEVLPGAVDAHTHLDSEPKRGGLRSADSYFTGTLAAAYGGVTTIVDYARQYEGMSLAETIEFWRQRAQRDAVIDYAFHVIPRQLDATTLSEVGSLVANGFPSMKLFMHRIDDDEMIRALEVLRDEGALAMVHCESRPIASAATARLVESGRASARHWPEARPVVSEYEATARAVAYCEFTKAPTYIVHVSSAEAAIRVRLAKKRRLPLWSETRPPYLLLTKERYEEPGLRYLMYTGYPPLRNQEDVDELWRALADGVIDTVASDHAAWSLEQKSVGDGDLRELPLGMPSLETQLSTIYSAGVVAGRIDRRRFVNVMATNPAKLLGLFPRKGTIAEGSDADLVLIDPRQRHIVTESESHSGCGYEPYTGMMCTGWPVLVISRGEVLVDHGALRSTRGRGQLLHRQAFSAPAG